jgi:hypothetical protein
MSYTNPLMVELMVPRDPDVSARMQGFYENIGWLIRNDTGSEFYTYIHPNLESGTAPTVAYWQTENPGKQTLFGINESEVPSPYARGLRLPNLQELVEVCLVVPSDQEVQTIFERGGALLEAHTHTGPRDHEGRQEFRFSDPFNYSLRVTSNSGWEIETPRSHSLRFVEYIEKKGSGKLLPVVTQDTLVALAESKDIGSGQAKRAYGALVRQLYKLKYHDSRYRRDEWKNLAPFFELDSESRVLGLKPDRIGELVGAIRDHSVYVENMGQVSENLLLDLDSELNPTRDTSQID